MEALVWMTGRVGAEVEVRDSASPWATFRLACTPRTVRAGEWGDEQTTWVTVSCSHRLAEHVRLSLRKGDPVIVVGKLRTRRWFDANGLEHEQLQIRASSVGHDLTAGTSSFYRLRRNATEGAETPEGVTDEAAEVEAEVLEAPDFDEEPADDRPGEVAPTAQAGEPGTAEDQVATDQVTADRVAADRVAIDGVVTDRVATDRVPTGRLGTDPAGEAATAVQPAGEPDPVKEVAARRGRRSAA